MGGWEKLPQFQSAVELAMFSIRGDASTMGRAAQQKHPVELAERGERERLSQTASIKGWNRGA